MSHQCSPPGHLCVNGRPLSDAAVVRRALFDPQEGLKWLKELEKETIFDRGEEGEIVVRRIALIAEKRKRAQDAGKKGGLKTQKRLRAMEAKQNPEDKPDEAKAREQFAEFWEAFHYNKGKVAAEKKWLKKIGVADGNLFTLILSKARSEARRRPALQAKDLTPKMAQGWLSDRRWEDVDEEDGAPPMSDEEAAALRAQIP